MLNNKKQWLINFIKDNQYIIIEIIIVVIIIIAFLIFNYELKKSREIRHIIIADTGERITYRVISENFAENIDTGEIFRLIRFPQLELYPPSATVWV